MNILTTLIGQAKTTVSRAYLTSGMIPALCVLVGWRLYTSGLAQVQADLKVLATDVKGASANALFYGFFLAAIAGVFLAGRTLVLRMLQTVPGRVLSPLRRHLLAVQVSRWWQAHVGQSRQEERFDLLNWATERKFDKCGVPCCSPADVERALGASKHARAVVADLARRAESLSWVRRPTVSVVVDGLRGFYALNVADASPPAHRNEKQRWIDLWGEPNVEEMLKRIRAEIFREMVLATAEAQQQPDDEGWLAPTRLGNCVAALDDYALRRYGIGTSTLWIRLWGVLDDKDRSDLSQAQLAVETLANVTVAFAILAAGIALSAAIGLVRVFAAGQPIPTDWKTIAFISGCVALSVAAYRTAVFAFGAVAERIIRLIDLHRLRVLTAVGYTAPATVGAEQEAWSELDKFFTAGVSRSLKRPLTPPAAKITAAPAGGNKTPFPFRGLKP